MLSHSEAIRAMRAELDKFKVLKRYHEKSEDHCRCPICGDSTKSHRVEHLYMKLKKDTHDDAVYFSYHCKLCGAKAKVFSGKDIKAFKIRNKDLIEYIDNTVKNRGNYVLKSSYNYIGRSLHKIPIDCDVTEKIAYMQRRLGDCRVVRNPEKFKIIYDFASFFKENSLQVNTDYGEISYVKKFLRALHDNCIGFLSFDNTSINFRDISKNNVMGKRYIQYRLYPEATLTVDGASVSSFYTIPGELNSMAPTLSAVLAEGTFDILRIYSDFYPQVKRDDIVFASVANAHGYSTFLKKFLEYGIMFDDVTIYSDDDVPIKKYKESIRPLIPDAKITIHYNAASKDYGDKLKPFEDSTFAI